MVLDPEKQWVELVVLPGAPAETYRRFEVGITASNLEKSRAFYRSFVGLEELPPVADPVLGTTKYPFRHGDTTINVWSFGQAVPANKSSAGIQYVINNVEAVDAKAKAASVTIDRPLGPFGQGLRTIWLSDPDGVTNYFAQIVPRRRRGRSRHAVDRCGSYPPSCFPSAGSSSSSFDVSCVDVGFLRQLLDVRAARRVVHAQVRGDVLQQLQHRRHLALGEQIDLQIEVRALVGLRRQAVLAGEDEQGQEDGLERHHGGEQRETGTDRTAAPPGTSPRLTAAQHAEPHQVSEAAPVRGRPWR